MRIVRLQDKDPVVLSADFYNSDAVQERVCILTARDVTVIRSAIPPLYFSTRFGTWTGHNLFEVEPNGDLVDLLDELDYKLSMGVTMDIASAILYLADKLCCEGRQISLNGGIIGSFEDGNGNIIPIYGEDALVELPISGYPEGYADEQEYLLDKCRVANALVDGWVASLRGIDALLAANAVLSVTAIVAAVTGVITLGASLIPLVIAAAVTIAVGGTLYAFTEEIVAQRDELVCALYEGTDQTSIIAVYADIIDLAIEAIQVTGPVGVAIKSLALVLANSDTLNQLFSYVGDTYYPDATCDNCGAVDFVLEIATMCDPPQTMGSVVSGSLEIPGAIEIASSEVWWSCNSQTPAQVIAIVTNPVSTCFSVTGATTDADQYWGYDGTGTEIPFAQATPIPDGTYQALYIKKSDYSACSVSFTWDEC